MSSPGLTEVATFKGPGVVEPVTTTTNHVRANNYMQITYTKTSTQTLFGVFWGLCVWDLKNSASFWSGKLSRG